MTKYYISHLYEILTFALRESIYALSNWHCKFIVERLMMANSYFGGSVWCNLDVALRHSEIVYKQQAKALGLTVIEWYVLRTLYEQDGQMASRLSEAVGRPATSFTPILDKIENKGLIERRSHPADRRAIKIHLTKQGQALKERVAASAERIERKLRQQFSGKEWQGYTSVIADLQTMIP